MSWEDDFDRVRWSEIDRQWRGSADGLLHRWSKLTDGDVAEIQEKRELLSGKLQQRYGMSAAEARRAMGDWLEQHAAATSRAQSPPRPQAPAQAFGPQRR